MTSSDARMEEESYYGSLLCHSCRKKVEEKL